MVNNNGLSSGIFELHSFFYDKIILKSKCSKIKDGIYYYICCVGKKQFKELTANQRSTILDSIQQQLVHEPLVETKNRKLLRPNPIAPWELRIGKMRVFYDVEQHESNIVWILAVGIKRGNKLFIAGKEMEL